MCDTHEPPRKEPAQGPNASVFDADEARKLAIGKEGIEEKKSKKWAKKKGRKTVGGGQRRKGKEDDRKRRLDDW